MFSKEQAYLELYVFDFSSSALGAGHNYNAISWDSFSCEIWYLVLKYLPEVFARSYEVDEDPFMLMGSQRICLEFIGKIVHWTDNAYY